MSSYEDLPKPHVEVQHSTGEYVRGNVYTNNLELFWSMLKRGYVGVYHRLSEKHLDRYVKEYANRRSMRELDIVDQMRELIVQIWGVRLSWSDLSTYLRVCRENSIKSFLQEIVDTTSCVIANEYV